MADPSNANSERIIPLHTVNTARSAEMLIEAGSKNNLSAKIHSRNPYNYSAGAIPLRVSVESNNRESESERASTNATGCLSPISNG